MRNLVLLLPFIVLFCSHGISQCDPPEQFEWQFNSATLVTLELNPPQDVEDFTLDFIARYIDSNGDFSDTLSYSGVFSSGPNYLDFDLEEVNPYLDYDTYYYEVQYRTACPGGGWSAALKSYISPFSLLNDPGFQEGDLHFSPITFLPDGTGVSYETSIIVPPDSIAEEIDSISVFIDIGHTYNGDLGVSITNPQGVTVSLWDFGQGGGASSGFSVLFQDGAEFGPFPPIQGTYPPSEPLSIFNGSPKSGVWTVTVTDNLGVDYGYLFGVGLYINSTPCVATVAGNVFYDLDEDGSQGAIEPGLGYTALFNSIDEQLFLSGTDGHYIDCSTIGQGEIYLTDPPMYYEAADPILNLNLAEGDFLTGYDFPLQAAVEVIDLEVDIFALVPDRPGFENIYYIQYENIGTVCAYDITVSVELDPGLELNSYSNPDIVTTGSGVDLLLDSLCPTQSGTFELNLTADITLMIGDTLFTTVSTSVIPDEVALVNNSETLESILVGSYDPNDKQVDQSEIDVNFLSSGRLEYMIRFQNTGNYYAERVVVTDLLPDELDMSTLSVMASSHDFVLSNTGPLVYFTFDDIFLPDSSTDPLGSNGFVRFEISPNDDLVAGSIIANGARIYFDFNPAIITNDAHTMVVNPVGLEEIEEIELSLFPNPADEQITLNWESSSQMERWEITDALGRLLANGYIQNERSQLIVDISSLASGTYSLRLVGETNQGSQHFTKR